MGVETEILTLIHDLLNRVWLGIQNLYNWLAPQVGAPAAFILTTMLIVLVPFLLINVAISRLQAVFEKGQAGVSSLALKGIATAVVTFIILFVLGGS